MKVTEKPKATRITFRDPQSKKNEKKRYKWWLARSKLELRDQLLSTAAFLKEGQDYRQRQIAIYARLYGNMGLFSFIGSNISQLDKMTGLPQDRPTFNLVQSAADTLISRIGQNRPSPIFLTDDSDYKERKLAKQLNNFISGEFYRLDAYKKAGIFLRDSLVTGDGILHVFETSDHKVGLERVLPIEMLIDPNESIDGDPRQLYRVKLVDRDVLMENYPGFKQVISDAETAYPDNSSDSSKTVADLVMVVEAWHLPSGKDAGDGRHTIACSAGVIYDEKYTKEKFPFVFLPYSKRLAGFWAQGLAEQLMGTQLEINSLLFTMSRAIKLAGVPRIFVEAGSKVSKASFNNDIGSLIYYQGVKPEVNVSSVLPTEMYEQLQRLIQYGFQQCGVSAMQAGGQKPAGLNSGEAQRVYDDIATDRFASLSRKWVDAFIELAYLVIDQAMDICKEQGSYDTIFPDKKGIKKIELPKMDILKNPFVIQCFDMSALPHEPAGRIQKVTEWIQGGIISIKEGRRLMDFPDLQQIETLANAAEERIYQILDMIVEDGIYNPPDPLLGDLNLAKDIVVQYYNLYALSKLEEDRCQMLRDWYTQCLTLIGIQTAPPPQQPMPQGAPQPQPKSELVQNVPGQQQQPASPQQGPQ